MLFNLPNEFTKFNKIHEILIIWLVKNVYRRNLHVVNISWQQTTETLQWFRFRGVWGACARLGSCSSSSSSSSCTGVTGRIKHCWSVTDPEAQLSLNSALVRADETHCSTNTSERCSALNKHELFILLIRLNI